MWLLILYYYFFNIFNSYLSLPFSHCLVVILPSLLLRSPRDTFYNLKRLIRFNYNLQPAFDHHYNIPNRKFHFFNWKVSRSKCISLIKFTSTLNTLFPLEKNFFHWEKSWNKSQRQCTKTAEKVILLYRDFFFFFFDFFGILLAVTQGFPQVHGKTTDEWHTDSIRVHASDIRVIYGWHTSTY